MYIYIYNYFLNKKILIKNNTKYIIQLEFYNQPNQIEFKNSFFAMINIIIACSRELIINYIKIFRN